MIAYRLFGESHGSEIGIEVTGLPQVEIDRAKLRAFLDRRLEGAPRHEPDDPVIEWLPSGHGSPVFRATIRNLDIRSSDYSNLRTVPRPGHADYAAFLKTGAIPSGGGRWSGRLTAPLCVAGFVALESLSKRGISISARVVSTAESNCVPGDSYGAIVEVTATGVPAGLGDAGTDGLESLLSAAFFGIPAVKGVEFGDGFRLAAMHGSEANDAFDLEDAVPRDALENVVPRDVLEDAVPCDVLEDAVPRDALENAVPRDVLEDAVRAVASEHPRVKLRTNHCGGILGGVSVGAPIVARLAFKPTPSIALEQDSVDLATMQPVKISVKGRHDRCVAYRACPAVESAMALVLIGVVS